MKTSIHFNKKRLKQLNYELKWKENIRKFQAEKNKTMILKMKKMSIKSSNSLKKKKSKRLRQNLQPLKKTFLCGLRLRNR